ncbi:MAG: formimidoylglutamate deiminase [Myxococcales bacterium]|nr:formimidoylglutamate deiminase [Myxococcales bacterium]MCB9531929.1 formimidoylglutamate deiminase [Myxococcales bacterium]MCB9533897.1 formimidoylglutamate deiminase [Myxococcales bacterium]
MSQRLFARWALLPTGWTADVALSLDAGRIDRVELDATPRDTDTHAGIVIPAFHDGHSHVFQWELRGHTNFANLDRPADDFWSWRTQMYEAADAVEPGRLRQTARECYAALRASGYASVAEFHYLHHDVGGRPFDPPWATAAAIADAAREVGIHLTLVPVAYVRGGHDRELTPSQRRFAFDDVNAFVAYTRDMRDALAGPGVSVAIGAHSVRAVPAPWLRAIAAEARARRCPLHIHASEQPRELEECVAEHGRTPIRLLHDLGFLGPTTVVVHATHPVDDEVELLAESGAIVCACPTTERDLGDGTLDAPRLLRAGVDVCIGSDSQVGVDARDELRLLELNCRLVSGRRNVLIDPARGLARPSATLLRWGAEAGARAVGLDSGRIEAGRRADLIELDAPELVDHEALLRWVDRWLFCGEAPAPRVRVGG